MTKQAFILAVLAIAESNKEGFTISANNLAPITAGYSVACKETQNSFGAEGLAKVYDAINAGLAQSVGGWYDSESGLYYFDAVNIYQNRNEAITAGRNNLQLAIFDLNNLEEIRL